MIPTANNLKAVQVWLMDEIRADYSPREKEQIIRILEEDVLGLSRSAAMLRDDVRITEGEIVDLLKCVKRLNAGEPIQYITGKTWFCGLELSIAPGVLIPRPETEELAAQVIEHIGDAKMFIMDLCTGSGCIAMAVKSAAPRAQVFGLEKSVKALKQARTNAERLELEIEWVVADIFEDTWISEGWEGQVDIIVSNPPYIARSEAIELHSRVLDHEPGMALFVEKDPLEFYRRIAVLGKKLLQGSGHVACEIHEKHGRAIMELFQAAGYEAIELKKDLQNKERMLWARC